MTHDEKSWLDRYDPNDYDRPSVAVDVVLLATEGASVTTVLLHRERHPFHGHWCLPGGFVGVREGVEAAARRVLVERIGLRDVFVEQLYTFGHPDRDPRMRVLTVAHVALVDAGRLRGAIEGRPARLAEVVVPWPGETGGPVEAHADGVSLPLAFDHADILGMSIKRIRGKLDYTPVGFQLLPEAFTLRALQEVHEAVLGRGLNKDSFRRRMLATGQLEATGEREQEVGHRPAELYRFVRRSAI